MLTTLAIFYPHHLVCLGPFGFPKFVWDNYVVHFPSGSKARLQRVSWFKQTKHHLHHGSPRLVMLFWGIWPPHIISNPAKVCYDRIFSIQGFWPHPEIFDPFALGLQIPKLRRSKKVRINLQRFLVFFFWWSPREASFGPRNTLLALSNWRS